MRHVLLFAYGSLVSHGSLAATLGRRSSAVAAGVPAVLHGHRRAWNVGSNRESHPDRILTRADGSPFTGTLAVLGLTPDPAARTNGVLYRLAAADLEALAVRERNYAPLDVTGAVRAPGLRAAPSFEVVTFAPTVPALERLLEARDARTAVVRVGYVQAVAHAFAAVGHGQLATFRSTTTPHRLPAARLTLETGRRRALPRSTETPALGPRNHSATPPRAPHEPPQG